MAEKKGIIGDPDLLLAVVVPIYKNADTIAELARRIEAGLAPYRNRIAIVLVVDASPDDSSETSQRIAAEMPCVRVVPLNTNVGQHAAVLVGLAQCRACYYAVLDGDLQDPPEFLRPMLELAMSHGTTVFAERDGAYQARRRMLTSRLFKGLVQRLIGLPATFGTYVLMPEPVVAAILELRVRHPQIAVMAWLCSDGTSSLPYRRQQRLQGRSSYSEWGRLKAAWRTLRCAWSLRRYEVRSY